MLTRLPLAVTAVLMLAAAEPDILTPGQSVRREIRSGETHSYAVAAKEGQFVGLRLQQRGADVAVRLLGPDSQQLASSDLPNGNEGPEVIAVIIPRAGMYSVIISRGRDGAATGIYDFNTTVRDAVDADREAAAAELIFARAEKLKAERTAESRKAAIAEYDRALPYFEKAGDRYRQALVLNSVGLLYAQAGDMHAALPRYEKSVRLFEEIGDARRAGVTANNVGGAYDVLGDIKLALTFYEKAVAMLGSTGHHAEVANTLNNIGKLYMDQAEWQKAVDYFRRALMTIAPPREPVVLANLGTVYSQMREYDTAGDYFRKALDKWSATGNTADQGITLNVFGATLLNQGRHDDAVDLLQRALTQTQAVGDRRGQGLALNYLGVAWARMGQTEKALDYLGRAIQILHTAADRRLESTALSNIAGVYTIAGDPRKSLDAGQRALSGFQSIGDVDGEGQALLALATAHRAVGNLAEARKNAELALARIEQTRSRAVTAESRVSFFAGRQDAYAFTIDLLMDVDERDPTAGSAATALEVSERSRARTLLELAAESGSEVRQGVDPALLTRERDISHKLNAAGARLLRLQGRVDSSALALQQDIRNLEREYAEVQTAIRNDSPRYAALTQPKPLTVAQIQRDVLDSESLLLHYSLGETRSFLWMVGKASLAWWVLPSRSAIESSVTRVSEALTARTRVIRTETPGERRARIAAADESLATDARVLGEMILGPAFPSFGGKRLIIVPDGALQRLPFAMLRVDQSPAPLLASNELVVIPSASVMAVLRQETQGRKLAPKTLALFADPVFNSEDPRVSKHHPVKLNENDPEVSRLLEHLGGPAESSGAATLRIPRLPWTQREAEQVLRTVPAGSSLKAIGFDASRATAISGALSDYRYIHFATHGYVDPKHPSLSALVLSQFDRKGNAQEGFLRVSDVYNAKLSADLVVLSACETGLGKDVRGEGLMGFTRAFLYAGAPRVVVSLWNVNDRATADLMASFYGHMLRGGKSPTAALRAAQLELSGRKEWAAPYYWAAFVQYGEWR